MTEVIRIDPETLAYWYLRLNGFLTITNFVVHPDDWRGRQRTDVDVMAARFPHRSELLVNPMEDDPALIASRGRILIYVAEVKTGTCNLNGPWTEPDKKNMQRVVRSVGAFPLEERDKVAVALYEEGFYENQSTRMSLMCIGSQENREKRKQFPEVPQITWDHILDFIFRRFNEYRGQKRHHPQWPREARRLFQLSLECKTCEEFIARLEVASRRQGQRLPV